jgi:dipeptidyl aminopeptidase/acylaminoacyl peptidase
MEDIYPNFSCDELVSEDTSPAFIWHTADDTVVNVRNSYLYATALRKHNVSCEMHIFPNGRHGLGLAATEAPHVAQWAGLLQNWLGYIGWL